MAAITRALNGAFPVTASAELAVVWQLAFFVGAGLLLSLVLMIYGVDFGPEFF